MAENGTSKSRKESLDPRPWHGHTADLKWSEFSVKPQKPGLDSSCTAMFWASMFDVMGECDRNRRQARELKFQVKNKTEKKTIKEVGTKEGNAAALSGPSSRLWDMPSRSIQHTSRMVSLLIPKSTGIRRITGSQFYGMSRPLRTLVQSVLAPRVQKRLKKSSCWLDPRFLPKMFQAKLVTVHHSFFLGDPSFCQLSTQQHIKSACASAKFHCCFHEIH